MKNKKFYSPSCAAPGNREWKTGFLLLLLSFAFGSIVGSISGSFFGFESVLSDFAGVASLGSMSYFRILLHFIRFHLVVILLASSFLGIALLPLTSCLRGYALSCTAATIISADSKNGLIMALLTLGIPAIFSLPCFFVMSVDGYLSSKRIFTLARGVSAIRTNGFLKSALVCMPVLAAGALIEMKLVPYLVSLLT